MKIYTKTGDDGKTSLFGGERVLKTDERVEAYGSVDELMAFTALLSDQMRSDAQLTDYVSDLDHIGAQLMSIAALLSMGEGQVPKDGLFSDDAFVFLEKRIDTLQATLKPIKQFTIPGGHATVSMCHVCRTICRRAERAALRAATCHTVNTSLLIYLNRLSDYFYVLGRALTQHFDVQEILWNPYNDD
ncbi:MAG: cob(I)yrinic acid a,c-diamide adenosyltransferase [Alistipes sp.]